MRAALYLRVSTRDQKEEGSSLESQLQACRKFAEERHLTPAEDLVFEEDWTGATLDRPKLSQVRELIKERRVDALISYATDRLARNPIHLAIIAEECDKSGVMLLFVTEPIDTSPEGQLIQYVKGYAAQIEREKIADRTLRGKKMRALHGKIPAGCGTGLYGYDYIPGKGTGQGIRIVNEEQARVVRMIYHWLVDQRKTLYAICVGLTESGIPTPKGSNRWGLSTVGRLLRNSAYTGKTYAFKYLSVEPSKPKKQNKRYTKVARKVRPREEWIELPGATPQIISDELFKAAQEQLSSNFERAKRNTRSQYLLNGHIRCGLCGQRYNGYRSPNHRSITLRYHCAGKSKTVSVEPCPSHSVAANEVEDLVWGQVKEMLLKRDQLKAELKRRREGKAQATHLSEEAEMNLKRLEALDLAETRALRLHLYSGMPEEKLCKELKRIQAERQRITDDNAEINKRLDEARQSELDEVAIMKFCEQAGQNIEEFTFEQKRQTLDALHIRAIVKAEGVRVTGVISPLVSTQSR